MERMNENKRSRGRQPGSLKPNARRVAIKIRWTEEEIEEVRAAAGRAGEDVSSFVRSAALGRCRNI
jgi:uncharacterized protein (DUF1778 family)